VGVYNHVVGDGREFVVADPLVLKIRAEDGRSITSVDVSPFISNLPFGKDTTTFTTLDASGSTSMAANIQEAIEFGCTGFLFDEDTCATNFLIRDQRMQQLISSEMEPITPLISKIRSLYRDLGCSSILVVGGCGSYLDVADTVISMDSYVAKDVTLQAKQIASRLPELHNETRLVRPSRARIFQLPQGPVQDPANNDESQPQQPQQPGMFHKGSTTKSAARRTKMITFSGTDVDLGGLDQLVHLSQSRVIVDSLVYLRDVVGTKRSVSVVEGVMMLESLWEREGMEVMNARGGAVGDYARPRGVEVVAALNRVRGLKC
ncbi:hypothetical protein HDU98_001985, partial [Podochytrium sp. JEL0797]